MDNNEKISKNYINKFLICLNKCFYGIFFPIILLIFAYFINKYVLDNNLITVIIYFIIIFYWIIKLIYIPKNISKKFGIIFLIDNSSYYDDNRNLFFKRLSYMLEDNFKVIVVNRNFLKKFDNSKKVLEIINKKHYQMIINTFAMNTNDKNDFVCSLDNKSITFATPIPELDENTIKNLQNDLNNGFQKIIKLRKYESYNDVNENSELMASSIRYIVSIIFIIFGNLKEAENLLKDINLSSISPSNKIVQYLRNNIVKRNIDIYFIYAFIQINKMQYLYDANELIELEKNIFMLETLIHSNFSNKNYFIDFYDMKSKMLFAQKNYYDSFGLIEKINRKDPSNYIILLSLGFMSINMNDIPKGMEYYRRVSKRQDVDLSKIEECIKFTNQCLKNESFNKNNLNICIGVMKYYWIDKDEGRKILNSVYLELEASANKKFIKDRYLN